MPKDPMILLSYLNTQLRDFYSSLDEFCASNHCSKEDITKKMAAIDYLYDNQSNQFI